MNRYSNTNRRVTAAIGRSRHARFALPAILAAIAAAGALLAPVPALAHAEHGQPVHGGIVAEAGVFQGELVAQPAGLVLFITDHGKPVPTQGASARLVVLAAGHKSEVPLAPAGENRLEGRPAEALAAGAKAVASVRLADGRAGALRFELK